MAVEKSYARLGLFLVVVADRRPRDGAALHSAVEEPRGDRDGDLHDRERQRPGCLEPGPVPGRAGGPRHRRCASIRAARTIEIDFEVFLDRLNTIGANVERIRQAADVERHVSQHCARRSSAIR